MKITSITIQFDTLDDAYVYIRDNQENDGMKLIRMNRYDEYVAGSGLTSEGSRYDTRYEVSMEKIKQN